MELHTRIAGSIWARLLERSSNLRVGRLPSYKVQLPGAVGRYRVGDVLYYSVRTWRRFRGHYRSEHIQGGMKRNPFWSWGSSMVEKGVGRLLHMRSILFSGGLLSSCRGRCDGENDRLTTRGGCHNSTPATYFVRGPLPPPFQERL